MIEIKIDCIPIGFVESKEIDKDVKKRKQISKLIINKNLIDALEGIENYSHLFVIFWMHKMSKENRRVLRVHPRGKKEIPIQGVFATRTSFRPNPIGLTLVELLKVKNNILTVRGLDAYDKTPILDIKPFDYWDMEDNVRLPEWWMQLEKQREKNYECFSK